MKKKNNKKNLLVLLVILVIITIGIGYAILSETLKLENLINYSSISWDVGFTSVSDNGGTITSTSSITNEGKTIIANCELGTSTDKESCIIKATITNNSTFDIGLNTRPFIQYDDTYIHTVTFKWKDHEVFGNTTVLQNGFIAKGTSQDVILTIKTKFLKEDQLPTTGVTIPIKVTLNFKEWREGELPTKADLAILKATSETDTTAFRSSEYKEKIKTITFENKINVPEGVTSWDIGVNENTVKAYVTPNQDDSTYYDLYIQSNGQLYANEYMGYWFYNLGNIDSINGLELLDTSMTTNMECMFYKTGEYSTTFTLDLRSFDTSKVTGINSMFFSTGKTNNSFSLDISKFDTSNIRSMSYTFYYTGYNSKTFILDVSNFDTSNVLYFSYTFENTGHSSTIFDLNVRNFDTSKVTYMNGMFYLTGYNSTILNIDTSNFDTSKVINMRYMFNSTGYSSSIFTLDVSSFNTSNVMNMEGMFQNTGYNNPNFTLDTSNFDTSKVTNMNEMFSGTGYNSTKFTPTITIRNPNTTSYENMFSGVATKPGAKINVNYTNETKDLVDSMIATKSSNSNVVKGKLVK